MKTFKDSTEDFTGFAVAELRCPSCGSEELKKADGPSLPGTIFTECNMCGTKWHRPTQVSCRRCGSKDVQFSNVPDSWTYLDEVDESSKPREWIYLDKVIARCTKCYNEWPLVSSGNIREADADPTLHLFEDDDEGYVAWISKHKFGFVLNSERPPTPNYLKLHRSSCSTVREQIGEGEYWTRTYLKACSERKSSLIDWAESKTQSKPDSCPFCEP